MAALSLRSEKPTCFVIDPVCAIDFGHALNSIRYFSNLAEQRWGASLSVASIHLPRNFEKPDSIIRFFDFYYDRYIPIVRQKLDCFGAVARGAIDPLGQALLDFNNFLYTYQLCDEDAIILANADLYSAAALTILMDCTPRESLPTIFMRFIGVMENAFDPEFNFSDIASRISRLKRKGYRLSVAAETPKLAQQLEKLMDCNVWVAPYPLSEEGPLQLPNEGPFRVLCGGSARVDKGFHRLPSIIDCVNKSEVNDIEFIVQNFPPSEQPSHKNCILSLYTNTTSVELIDGILPYSDIINAYKRSCISIMPYDAATYALRGSAMLMESIMFGRLVVGQSGTAFADQLLRYNAGEVCSTDAEFADAIIRLSSISRFLLVDQAKSSRDRYINDVARAYDQWLGEFS